MRQGARMMNSIISAYFPLSGRTCAIHNDRDIQRSKFVVSRRTIAILERAIKWIGA